jgi:hypothetical protein
LCLTSPFNTFICSAEFSVGSGVEGANRLASSAKRMLNTGAARKDSQLFGRRRRVRKDVRPTKISADFLPKRLL